MIEVGSPFWLYLNDIEAAEGREAAIERAMYKIAKCSISPSSALIWYCLKEEGITNLSEAEFKYIQSKFF